MQTRGMDSLGSEYDPGAGCCEAGQIVRIPRSPPTTVTKKIKQLYEVITLSCSTDGPNIYTVLFNQQQEIE
jgi:hypothetical protein